MDNQHKNVAMKQTKLNHLSLPVSSQPVLHEKP